MEMMVSSVMRDSEEVGEAWEFEDFIGAEQSPGL
jgi:hypothetical protein